MLLFCGGEENRTPHRLLAKHSRQPWYMLPRGISRWARTNYLSDISRTHLPVMLQKYIAGSVGFEPTTTSLTGRRSAVELQANMVPQSGNAPLSSVLQTDVLLLNYRGLA